MKRRPHLPRALWLPCLAVALLLLAGCTVAQPMAQQGALPSSAQPGIHIRGDTAITVDWTDPHNMCKGSLVAEAGIAGLGPSHWNTPNGARAATLDAQTILKNGYAIYTPIHFSSIHNHVDHRRQPTNEFATIGGTVGADSYNLGFPQVVPGGRYLLVFVPGSDPTAQGAWTEKWLVVIAAFPIGRQGLVYLKPPITEQGQVTQQEETVPLSRLAQQLAGCD